MMDPRVLCLCGEPPEHISSTHDPTSFVRGATADNADWHGMRRATLAWWSIMVDRMGKFSFDRFQVPDLGTTLKRGNADVLQRRYAIRTRGELAQPLCSASLARSRGEPADTTFSRSTLRMPDCTMPYRSSYPFKPQIHGYRTPIYGVSLTEHATVLPYSIAGHWSKLTKNSISGYHCDRSDGRSENPLGTWKDGLYQCGRSCGSPGECR